MARGISLHIGLNEVDPEVYGGKLPLGGCVNDANDLSQIATTQGFETNILLDSQATSTNLVDKITYAAQQLNDGDIFLLTYSGHGSSIPDNNGDESEERDEAWVLFNRQFLDDELFDLWLGFKAGVRIFVLSDSCHSGTMLKFLGTINRITKGDVSFKDVAKSFDKDILKPVRTRSGTTKVPRLMEAERAQQNYEDNKETYQEIQYKLRGIKSQNVLASIILISGCQDDEFSMDYGNNGLFTMKVKETWDQGSYRGSHHKFYEDIAQKVSAQESTQNPNFTTLGGNIDVFKKNIPFIINAPGWPVGSQNGASSNAGSSTSTNNQNSNGSSGNFGTSQSADPSVSVPTTWNPSNGIPEFRINLGSNNYYYIEVVTSESLFDYANWANNGTDQNSFFSWNDSTVNSRLTDPGFKIPIHIWNQLRNASTLYVRVGTTSSSNESEWADHKVSAVSTLRLESSGSSTGGNNTSNTDSGTSAGNNASGGSGTTNNSSSTVDLDQELSGSVGYQGDNNSEDVLLVQKLLNRVSQSEGGPSPQLTEDGQYGTKTRNAISRFQSVNGLDRTGKIESGSTTLLILKVKSGDLQLC